METEIYEVLVEPETPIVYYSGTKLATMCGDSGFNNVEQIQALAQTNSSELYLQKAGFEEGTDNFQLQYHEVMVDGGDVFELTVTIFQNQTYSLKVEQ